MPVRIEVNGKAAEAAKVYAGVGDAAKRVTRIYTSKDGKAVLCWARPGTPENPYRLRTPADFSKISRDLSACYRLEGDITLTTSQAIGTEEAPFRGDLDGNGHKLTSSRIPIAYNAGTIHGLMHWGTVVGKNLPQGRLYQCEGYQYAWYSEQQYGILTWDNAGTIEDCASTIAGPREGCTYAGLAFHNSGTIRRCYTAPASYLDYPTEGYTLFCFAWENTGTVDYCYAAAKVKYMTIGSNGRTGTAYTPEYPLIHSGNTPRESRLIYGDYNGWDSEFQGFDFQKVWDIQVRNEFGRGSRKRPVLRALM